MTVKIGSILDIMFYKGGPIDKKLFNPPMWKLFVHSS